MVEFNTLVCSDNLSILKDMEFRSRGFDLLRSSVQ